MTSPRDIIWLEDLLRSMKGRPATGPELRKAKYWLEKFDEDVEDQRRRRTICGTR